MIRTSLAYLFSTLLCTSALADTKATTDDGRAVILRDDGTWQFEQPKAATHQGTIYEDTQVRIEFTWCDIAATQSGSVLSITNKSQRKILKLNMHDLYTDSITGESTWLIKPGVKLFDKFDNDLGYVFLPQGEIVQPASTLDLKFTRQHAAVESSGGLRLALPQNTVGNSTAFEVTCSFGKKSQ